MPYNADGTIPKLPWFGNRVPEPGVAQVGSLNPYDTVQAETICFEKGVRTEVCKDINGKMNVDSIHNNDYIKVKGVDFKTPGPDLFEARVASGSNGGNIELRIDSLNGRKIGTCAIQGTGGWQNWVTKSCEVSNVTGKHDLFFKFTGGNGLLFNFNWWKFSSSTSTRGLNGNTTEHAQKVKITVNNGNVRNVHLEFLPSYLGKEVTVRVYDMGGRLAKTIYKNSLSASQLVLHIEKNDLMSGMYLVTVTVNENMVLTKKFNL